MDSSKRGGAGVTGSGGDSMSPVCEDKEIQKARLNFHAPNARTYRDGCDERTSVSHGNNTDNYSCVSITVFSKIKVTFQNFDTIVICRCFR